ncbi:MAG: CpsD/CapB family tyrosine-protein kinase [Hasllibacter sp.]
MERLQAAIERARRERDAAGDRAAPPPAAGDGAPVPPPAPEAAAPAGAVRERWDALAPLPDDPRRARRLRGAPRFQAEAAYNLLRTRIVQQAQAKGWRRIGIVSPDGGCGKSTVSANLALSFARQSDFRVLVLDMDLRRIGLSRTISARPATGMASVLEGSAPFAKAAYRVSDSVALGLNGAPHPAPAELVQSRATLAALERMEADYAADLVLIDLPPLFSTDDNQGFLPRLDAAVIVVAADQTKLSRIDAAEREVAGLTSVMGVVLNKCRYRDASHGFDYDY